MSFVRLLVPSVCGRPGCTLLREHGCDCTSSLTALVERVSNPVERSTRDRVEDCWGAHVPERLTGGRSFALTPQQWRERNDAA